MHSRHGKMMRTLALPEERESAREVWASVYRTKDPFEFPFRLGWLAVVFNRTKGYHLSEEQFDALTGAASALGDDEIFVVQSEYGGDFFAEQPIWALTPDTSYGEYRSLPLGIENSIFSCAGRWGGLLSQHFYCLVGGGREFTDLIKGRYGKAADDKKQFQEDWTEEGDKFPQGRVSDLLPRLTS